MSAFTTGGLRKEPPPSLKDEAFAIATAGVHNEDSDLATFLSGSSAAWRGKTHAFLRCGVEDFEKGITGDGSATASFADAIAGDELCAGNVSTRPGRTDAFAG